MASWPPADPASVLLGDCRALLATLPAGVFQTCVTSPPYWGLRDYGSPPQAWPAVAYAPLPGLPPILIEAHSCNLGQEATIDAFIGHLVLVFRAVKRVLRPDGTCWVNMGDAYTGGGGYYPEAPSNQAGPLKARGISPRPGTVKTRPFGRQGLGPKQLLLLPARCALALQADGWVLRSEIIWSKLNPLPESVTDRPTKAHEQIYLFSPQPRYYYDAEAVRERAQYGYMEGAEGTNRWGRAREATPGDGRTNMKGNMSVSCDPTAGRNLRDVWPLASQPYPAAHFATFPEEIPRRAILAGTSAKGQCPACGAPWRRVVARTPTAKAKPTGKGWLGATFRGDGDVAARGLGRDYTLQAETTDWQPGCPCDAGPPVPQWVLDPFAGSGTTLAVARSLGRAAVGCELQPAYLPLSTRRIAQAPVPLPALVEHL